MQIHRCSTKTWWAILGKCFTTQVNLSIKSINLIKHQTSGANKWCWNWVISSLSKSIWKGRWRRMRLIFRTCSSPKQRRMVLLSTSFRMLFKLIIPPITFSSQCFQARHNQLRRHSFLGKCRNGYTRGNISLRRDLRDYCKWQIESSKDILQNMNFIRQFYRKVSVEASPKVRLTFYSWQWMDMIVPKKKFTWNNLYQNYKILTLIL